MRRCWDRLLPGLLVALAVAAATPAGAECGCYCVDGGLRTLCTSPAEARSDPELCSGAVGLRCPVAPDFQTGSEYAPPDEAATNCRDVRVYDPGRGSYVTARACDVL